MPRALETLCQKWRQRPNITLSYKLQHHREHYLSALRSAGILLAFSPRVLSEPSLGANANSILWGWDSRLRESSDLVKFRRQKQHSVLTLHFLPHLSTTVQNAHLAFLRIWLAVFTLTASLWSEVQPQKWKSPWGSGSRYPAGKQLMEASVITQLSPSVHLPPFPRASISHLSSVYQQHDLILQIIR